jgi:integrase/recombinase XerC
MILPILTEWLKFLKENKKYSNNTLEAYNSDMIFFLNFIKSHLNQEINNTVLESLRISDFRAFLVYLTTNRNRNGSSKARTISTIKSFYRFCEKNNLLKNEAVFNIKPPKIQKPLPKALNFEETLESLEEIKKIENYKKNAKNWVSQRDAVLLKLIYTTGLRISEALNLKIKDLNNNFLVVAGKGKKERLVPLIDEILKDLRAFSEICPFINKNDQNSFIFLGKQGKKLDPAVFQKTIRDLRNQIGLQESITPHAYRHTFATHLLSESGDIRSVQELLGHANLSTTQIYTKVDKKRILKAFDNL